MCVGVRLVVNLRRYKWWRGRNRAALADVGAVCGLWPTPARLHSRWPHADGHTGWCHVPLPGQPHCPHRPLHSGVLRDPNRSSFAVRAAGVIVLAASAPGLRR